MTVDNSNNQTLNSYNKTHIRNFYDNNKFINLKLKKSFRVAYLFRPLAKPGFDTLSTSAPVLVQMNPDGKWENCKPDNMDEEKLKAVITHLVNSKTISAAQSYCCQCAAESQVKKKNIMLQLNYSP